MTTNRITGPGSPDSGRPQDTKAQREAAQKIEKVREVDPDEQAKNRQKFKMMMNDDTDDAPLMPAPRMPSPVDPKFYQSQANSSAMPDVSDAAVASPNASPPPDVNAPPLGMDLSGDDLPQSNQFWSDVDVPDEPAQPPSLQPKTGASVDRFSDLGEIKGSKKKGEIPPLQGKEKKEDSFHPSPFGTPGKSQKKETPESTPTGKFWAEEGRMESAPIHKSKEKRRDEKEEEKKVSPRFQKEEREEQTPREERVRGERFAEKMDSSKEREKGKEGKGHHKEQIHIISPSATPLPQDIQPYAIAATTVASPYLRPEAIPLFYQMVGSIMIMSKPGINRTEIVLNGANFTNSKFFGATIEITKYATAPDSLNIRLSGSNEAVTAFNQNIPSLMSAFQSGNFNFRIGRIDTSYSTERPLFKRKKEVGGDEGTGADERGER